ncbi:EamA family transporter [Sphingomonas sp. MAH-20]|uniref:EamA family transporter n=1 Tax=Sphingomonas horti TaxID=2682842 RepID=A0A6I4IXX1_9SPHN|nr:MULTISPECIES: DMT family transporter [Sphingomonas]MBA2920961.1 DMT family transporter [Sphingomonas sp. CGMCC 1.13658]MVO76947.1 EamA family transporter [Sphingomonas horti]
MHARAGSRKSIGSESGVAFAALIAGNVALAFGPLFVRLADTEAQIGPVAAAFWRLALAAPLLLMMTRVTRQPIGRLAPAMWATVVLAGIFFAADLGTWHLGILKTKLANATLIGNCASLLFPLYGFVVARAWPTRVQALALLLAAVGAGLMMGRSYELSPQHLVGDLLCLLAGVLYTFYLIAIDRARGQLQPWPVLALSTVFGVLPLLLFAWILGESIWPASWGPLIALALVSQVIGQGLLVYAMGHVRPLVTGLTFLLQPAVSAAIGWLSYGETLTALDWTGAALIAAAILAVKRPATNLAPPAD